MKKVVAIFVTAAVLQISAASIGFAMEGFPPPTGDVAAITTIVEDEAPLEKVPLPPVDVSSDKVIMNLNQPQAGIEEQPKARSTAYLALVAMGLAGSIVVRGKKRSR